MPHPSRRRSFLLVCCVLLASGTARLPAATAPELLADGRGLLAQDFPALAVIPLKEALALKGNAALPPAETRAAQILLAAAELRGNSAEAALAALAPVKDLGKGPQAASELLLQAQALAALQRWDEALAACQAASELGLPPASAAIAAQTRGEAELGKGNLAAAEQELGKAVSAGRNPRARFLLALTSLRQGQPKRCLELLKDLVPGQERLLSFLEPGGTVPAADTFAMPAAAKQVVLLQAEATAALGRHADAARLCDLVLRHPAGLGGEDRLRAALRKAWYEESGNQPEEAEDTLLQAIREHEEPALLQTAFSHLLALYTRHDLNSKVSLGPFLGSGDALRAPYAEFLSAYLLARAGQVKPAADMLGKMEDAYPDHPLAADARLLRARLTRGSAALAETPVDSRYAHLYKFESAMGWLADGEFAKAMRGFDEAAEQPGRLRLSARYNQALAALEARNQRTFRECLEDLDAISGAGGHVRALRLAAAASDLRRGNLDVARDELDALSATEPRAKLLLAELELREGRPKRAYELAQAAVPAPAEGPAAASREEPSPPTSEISASQEEQRQYILFWSQVNAPDSSADKLIENALAYLETYPDTEYSQLIRFKLAETYFQQSAFAQAQREFETVGEQTKDPTLKDIAEFQTGRAAALSMSERGLQTALEIFARIAKRGGSLREDALLEQAALLRDGSRYAEASAIYRELAEGRRPNDEIRLAALQGLAQCLFSEAGGQTTPRSAPAEGEAKEKLRQCLGVCEDLLEGAGGRPNWRNFALYMQGRCWQDLGDLDQCLIAYTKVITQPAGVGAEAEYLWFYRAGFGAVEILEARNQLSTALKVLSHLTSAGGPRVQEATERMKMIRLKNFVWDEPAPDPPAPKDQ